MRLAGSKILRLCCPIGRLCKKNTVKRRLFWLSGACCPILTAMWAHLGAMLAHPGAMLAHLGGYVAWPILGLCLPILGGYVAPSWGYVGRSWGLCWPMLTHFEPQDPKNGNSKKHRKTRVFFRCFWWSLEWSPKESLNDLLNETLKKP